MQSIIQINFLVIKIPSAYNAISSWLGLNTLQAMVSTYHLLVKFSTPYGIDKVQGDQELAKECYMANLHGEALMKSWPMKELDVRDELTELRGQPIEDLIRSY